MKFKNHNIELIFNGSQAHLYTHDAYVRLAEFEHQLVEYMRFTVLSDEDRLDGYKVLGLINAAQIRLLEAKLNIDLNNNGVIGE